MPLVFAAIAPHGGEIVPQLTDNPALMAKTRTAMQELGQRFAAAKIDTVIVLTPHGIVVEEALSIGGTRHAAGIVGEPDGKHIKAAFTNDLDFTEAVIHKCEQVPIPLVRLVGEEGKEKAVLPLDWGVVIPLWFTAHPLTNPRPQTVVVAPNRGLPRETLVRFGVVLAQCAAETEKRIALIASCDQGHAHDPDGPYGFSPVSAEHDGQMCAAVVSEDLGSLLDWDEAFLEEAKVDAFWQTIILAGALGHTPLTGELLSYEAPTYFGMLVAAYE
jgi:aromatic ring-opening dioxygenase LigB subunit